MRASLNSAFWFALVAPQNDFGSMQAFILREALREIRQMNLSIGVTELSRGEPRHRTKSARKRALVIVATRLRHFSNGQL